MVIIEIMMLMMLMMLMMVMMVDEVIGGGSAIVVWGGGDDEKMGAELIKLKPIITTLFTTDPNDNISPADIINIDMINRSGYQCGWVGNASTCGK